MDPVVGAVVIAGLKYMGSPGAELVKDFVGKVIGPTANAIGTAMASPIERWQQARADRAHALLLQSAGVVQGRGIDPQPVPSRTLMPLIERASMEDDEYLFKAWVHLLASAAIAPTDVPPSYVAVLSELAPSEAKTLEWLYEKGHPTIDTYGAIGFFPDVTQYTHTLAFANLHRLKLVDPSLPEQSHLSIDDIERQHSFYDYVSLTPFGIAFVDACKGRVRLDWR